MSRRPSQPVALPAVLLLLASRILATEPTNVGTRLEPLVDDYLIDSTKNGERRLTEPVRQEVVLTLDQPWEDPTSAYFTIFRDGDVVRLYYRGKTTDDSSENQTTCYAESRDGIHFTRPVLDLVEWDGSKANNICYCGPESAAFAPFRDASPACKPDERYKAVCYRVLEKGTGSVFAMASADGIQWRRMSEKPILPPGSFDSLNTAFYDPLTKRYRLFGRYWTGGGFAGVRGIVASTSDDFLNWAPAQPFVYAAGVPLEHFYTNAIVPAPDAPHILLSFPMRFVPGRKKVASHSHRGVSDAVFMTSRDGVHWDRTFLHAWLRPGPDERNWTERNTMTAWGVVRTSPDEYSMYVSEHYRWPDNRLRRVTVPRDRWASVGAGADGGEFTTKPLKFAGRHLILNYATSAVGAVQVELQDAAGKPIDGFTLAESPARYGDEFDGVVTWKGGGDLSKLAGQPVRLRFVLKDADVYALRFADEAPKR